LGGRLHIWRCAMCCFSRPVELVTNTNIFARAGKDHRQYLVYSMQFKAAEDLAMILPLPTPKGAPEDAVKFINLEDYADFFAEMHSGFPVPPMIATRSNTKAPALAAGGKLEVIQVGSFEASFVPGVKDFVRLDECFRLPAGTWDALPQYKDWG